MQIIRTAIWVIILIAYLIFAVNNWTVVEIKIWEGLIWETKLPALLLAAFLAGLSAPLRRRQRTHVARAILLADVARRL